MSEPALWLPSLLPAKVILDAAPEGMGGHCAADILGSSAILADHRTQDGRHLAVSQAGSMHHIWLRAGTMDGPIAFILPRDPFVLVRSRASLRLDRDLSGLRPTSELAPWAPTRFQRRRLDLLLAILDARQADDPPATYDIGTRLVFPGLRIARGAQWKASTERRRTLRLIGQAQRLMTGGYRDLLRGEVKG